MSEPPGLGLFEVLTEISHANAVEGRVNDCGSQSIQIGDNDEMAANFGTDDRE